VPRSWTVPDPPALIEQLESVLASRDFDASSRGRTLLRFLVGEMLANRQESLSLASIARQVFRRGEDFDSRLDPAVGIEVARLRRALDRYYRLAGAGDPVRISLPRGESAPVAQWVPGRASVRRGSSLDLEESPVATPS
jgi:adenylate cyclase